MIKSHKSYHFLTNQFYALASFLRPLLGWLEREEYDPAVDAIFSWTRPVKSKCGSSNSVQSPPTSSRLQSNTESCLAMLNPHFKFKKTANLFFFFFQIHLLMMRSGELAVLYYQYITFYTLSQTLLPSLHSWWGHSWHTIAPCLLSIFHTFSVVAMRLPTSL